MRIGLEVPRKPIKANPPLDRRITIAMPELHMGQALELILCWTATTAAPMAI